MKRLKRLIILMFGLIFAFSAVFTDKPLYPQSPDQVVSYVDISSDSNKVNSVTSERTKKFLEIVNSILENEKVVINEELLKGEKIDRVPKGYVQEKDWRYFVDSINIEKLDIVIAQKIYNYVSNTIFYKREKEETWQTSKETFIRKAGDCEDYAIQFYDICTAKNLKVRVAIGEVKSGNRWWCHGFNLLYINNKVYLVDCAFGVFDKIENVISNYKVKYTFDKAHIYRHNELENIAKPANPTKNKSTLYGSQLP